MIAVLRGRIRDSIDNRHVDIYGSRFQKANPRLSGDYDDEWPENYSRQQI
ncbi:hypothetical protein BN1221_01334c [Brenneria goodwinii]|uniref:Uncharacterized protein n=1 Tax=Brenneria goodwinii TaxID=1109412 RepID=A0A0G4JT56_9GAMM|nr:hypothetical protein BN1221_01334c [Brenneria goodwinii]